MHTRKHGKSRSRKPLVTAKWVKADKKKIEELVEKMAREGIPSAKIGLLLRDQHAIPDAKSVLGAPIEKFLKQKKLLPEFPQDLLGLIKKAVRLRKHLGKNKKDTHNRTHLHNIESKINRLVRYYRGKKIPAGWKYVPEEAALLVK